MAGTDPSGAVALTIPDSAPWLNRMRLHSYYAENAHKRHAFSARQALIDRIFINRERTGSTTSTTALNFFHVE